MEKLLFSDEHENILFNIPLFRDLPENVKKTLLGRLDYAAYEYLKKDVLIKQNTTCKSLFVLLKGKLRVDIVDANGNEVMIEYIVAPRAFATPHLFNTDNTMPATFTAVEDGVLFTATKESLFKLISEEPNILLSFLKITGNCNRCTVRRLRSLSYKNVRSRFIAYILEHNPNEDGTIEIEHNQAQLAEYLCITRPALSREINKMVKENIIEMEGKRVIIKNLVKIKEYV